MIYRRDGLFTPANMGTVIGTCTLTQDNMGTVIGTCTLTQDAFSSLESTTSSANVDIICLCRSSWLNVCTYPLYFV